MFANIVLIIIVIAYVIAVCNFLSIGARKEGNSESHRSGTAHVSKSTFYQFNVSKKGNKNVKFE